METVFGNPFFNSQSFFLIVGRLAIDLLVITLLSTIFLSYSNKKESIFTFVAFNVPVFFLIYLMSLTEISIGIGFGLFAIFTILRYRTQTVSLKEMSYLFLFISVAVMNGLVVANLSFVELIFFNGLIILTAWLLEYFVEQKTKQTVSVTYDKVELLRPENRSLLIEDLQLRTGLTIQSVEVKNYDFIQAVAKIQVVFDDNV